MKFKIYLFTAIVVVLFTASSVFAFQATFLPRISLSEEYSDNLFLTENNEKDDLITIISIGFTTELLWQRGGIEISYDPARVLYHDFSENDTWRHTALLNGWVDLTRNNRLETRNALVRTEDPLGVEEINFLRSDDPAIIADTTLRTTREPYWTSNSSVRFTNRFGENDSFYLEIASINLENEDEILEDNTRNIPSAGLTYWFTPQWGFELIGTYTKAEYYRGDDFYNDPAAVPSDDFEESNGSIRLIRHFTRQFEGHLAYSHIYVDFEKTKEDYQIYNPFIGFEYSIAQDKRISLNVGYFVQDNSKRAGNIDDESGMTAEGVFEKTFQKGSISLSGSAGHDEAFFGAENLGFSIFYEAGLEADYNLTRRITGNIFGSYRQDKYEDEIPVRRDKTTRSGVGLSYTYERWLSSNINFIISAEYSYNNVNSNFDINDYVENRGLLAITLTRSQPYRSGR
jgi:putative beta-barrel porin BBP2